MIIIFGGETVHLPFTWHEFFIYWLGFLTPIFLLLSVVCIIVIHDAD